MLCPDKEREREDIKQFIIKCSKRDFILALKMLLSCLNITTHSGAINQPQLQREDREDPFINRKHLLCLGKPVTGDDDDDDDATKKRAFGR